MGGTIRKTAGKDTALIYTIYLSYTHDFNTLRLVRQATDVGHENKDPRISTGNLDRYIL
jgi:hypothetical protein